jgi:nucleoside-diphosphate-sugar epimerase
MKKILVIGNQGYLGSRLTDYLQNHGYCCTGVDIGFFRDGLLFPPKPVPMLGKEARTLEESDIEGFDVVLQLAGISNDPFGNLSAERIYDPTRIYAMRIAKICKKIGVKFIFPSSCSVYGIGTGMMDEDGSTNPQTHYSINKVQVEQDLASISDASFSPIALRLATVFGASPRMRFDVVINMLCGMAVAESRVVLNSNGQAWRPHVFIEDVCEAFRCCIEWDYRGGKLMVLNVGRNDNNQKILDVARTIQQQMSDCTFSFLGQDQGADKDDLVKDRKIKDGVDTRTYQVSFNRIHQTLPGFQARWTVEAGIHQLLNDLQSNGLDRLKFKQREFYRLQQIEYLYNSAKLNESLQWN